MSNIFIIFDNNCKLTINSIWIKIYNEQLIQIIIYLTEFINLENTPLYEIENIEQLKVLENGYKIKSFLAPFFIEISLDTQENYDYLVNKYC